MTNFTKDNFRVSRGYVTYIADGRTRFVARFKYGATSSARPFATFIRRNFTVEEYFGRLDAGESPLEIAASKGFVLSHLKTMLRKNGYEPTQAGLAAYRAARYGY